MLNAGPRAEKGRMLNAGPRAGRDAVRPAYRGCRNPAGRGLFRDNVLTSVVKIITIILILESVQL